MNLHIVRTTVIDLCKEVGEKIKDDFTSGDYSLSSKGGMDFLTDVDARTDEFLRVSLKRHFPKTQFLTEETAGDDYVAFGNMDDVWIIDPIDGTTNFSKKNPHFSISVGLVSKGKTKLGVVYLPVEDKLYVADEETDHAVLNDIPITVSNINTSKTSTFAFDWSWDMKMRQKTYEKLSSFSPNVRQLLTLGCASADMCLVAAGLIDAYFIYGIKPWDIAASSLILKKAGGKITRTDGSIWNVFDSDLIASNGLLHDEVVHLLT